MDKQIEVNDFLVCKEHYNPLIENEIIKIKEIHHIEIGVRYEFYGYPKLLFEPSKFEFYDYYNIPFEDGTYPRKPNENNKKTELNNDLWVKGSELKDDFEIGIDLARNYNG